MEWRDDYTNVRTWEIWAELQRNHNMDDEDIKNLPLECFFVAGIVQKIIREHSINWRKEKQEKHKVEACHDSKFNGIDCLENSHSYGFFRSHSDFRPGHAIWIKKKDVNRLFEVFKDAQSKA